MYFSIFVVELTCVLYFSVSALELSNARAMYFSVIAVELSNR
jgi:hypothetical protein